MSNTITQLCYFAVNSVDAWADREPSCPQVSDASGPQLGGGDPVARPVAATTMTMAAAVTAGGWLAGWKFMRAGGGEFFCIVQPC